MKVEKLIIYYSIEDCGDGSAYPRLFDTEELAEWNQNNLDQGWGEPCTGEIVVEGKNMSCSELQTKEGFYLELLLEGYENQEEVQKFKDAFFPEGLPKFTVDIIDSLHYGIFVEGRIVHKSFAYPEKKTNNKGIKRLEKILKRKIK
ncbi:hypothetical protein LCGC14_0142440 [marine sediment metagenome]|uniref:Uncharacterized protein n=1 Tax=marine sediment metagenome TaxID=412755 RepID=A0A0F9V4T4_9ZZZZ